MKNELIAVTTHEIRSPLTSIKGALDLMDMNDKNNQKENPILQIARSNCDRLLRLSNDILDLQKMESGKMVFYPKDFWLEDLFNKVIEINKIFAQTHDIKLVKPATIPHCMIYADEDRILQVMTNFVSNAIKNSPKDSEITFEVNLKGDRLHIGVRDHGPGIPKEFQHLIFKKFSQVPTVSKAKDGTGLGLSISKSIIKEHNGSIGFDTSEDGTVFWFEIPLKHKRNKEDCSAEQIPLIGEGHEQSK